MLKYFLFVKQNIIFFFNLKEMEGIYFKLLVAENIAK